MYISALYRMLRSRTFKRTATSDEHARKFRIWRSLVLIDISKLMSLNSVVLVITQLNSFYVFSFGLVYSARATGCCNEAILFVLVDFTSIVGSISNRNKIIGTIVLALEELGCYYLRGMSVGNHLNVRVIRELFLKFLQFAPAEGGYC